MSRPRKNTVDYFPHSCKHGKTIYILEQRFGNNGYALWFKLLEELGNRDNHYIDLREDTELEFLAAKTRLSVTETLEMLDLVSKLGAIDGKLWGKRIIFCQQFVDNIADVYKKRNSYLPRKPSLRNGNIVIGSDNLVKDSQNPQSKVKESKLNNNVGFKKPKNDERTTKNNYGLKGFIQDK